MAEGIERVSNSITRYAIFETIYQRAALDRDIKDGLGQSLVKLYKVVLEYLCKAQRYYGDHTLGTPTHTCFTHFSLCS